MDVGEALRRRERALRDVAADLRETARRLVDAADDVWWEGRTGQALRAASRVRAEALRAAADRYDEAAESLADHRRVVRRRGAALAAAALEVGEEVGSWVH